MWSIYLISIALVVFTLINRQRNKQRLPPSPLRSYPIIGNLGQVLEGNDWLKRSREWHRKYGPLVTLKLGSRNVILIGNQETANELMGKRGRIYSSRPRFVLALEIMSGGDHTLFLPYGNKWKVHNRMQMSILNPRAIRQYRAIQELESQETLLQLLDGNEKTMCYKRFQASLLHALAYGTRMPDVNDPDLVELEVVSKAFLDAVATGNWLVDSFPFLKHLPECLAPWKRWANQIHAKSVKLNGKSIQAAQKTSSWNWVKHMREMKESDLVTDHELVFIFGSLYLAGVDIVNNILQLFVMSWLLNPKAVQIAQEELDRVVGHDRLPTFDDIPNLPYIDAFVKEVIRWRPLAGVGTPHALTEDDTYMGYQLPKGTIFLANQFSMELDPQLWDDPESFQPQRWIDNPSKMLNSFGFGRRKCVGQYLAMDSLSIMIARMLWVCKIELAPGEEKPHLDSWDFIQDGFVFVPKPFNYTISARDSHREEILRLAKSSAESLDNLLNIAGQEISGEV
ncbi:hypothetical protein F1880_002269 [Penicillium rolfsii]|nr:hypothetical protein F1880_002269 [Penicillium rolfsii]